MLSSLGMGHRRASQGSIAPVVDEPVEHQTVVDPRLRGRAFREIAAIQADMREALDGWEAPTDPGTGPAPVRIVQGRPSRALDPRKGPAGVKFPVETSARSAGAYEEPELPSRPAAEPRSKKDAVVPPPNDPILSPTGPLLPKEPLDRIPEPGWALPPALDLASALGVDPDGQPGGRARSQPTKIEEPNAERIDVSRFLSPKKRWDLGRLRRAPDPTPLGPASKKGRPTQLARPEELKSLAQNTGALAKVLPLVLAVFVGLAMVGVFVRLASDRSAVSPHVELQILRVPGEPAPRIDANARAHMVIVTEPRGILVFHGQDILGKTPCEAELPLDLPPRVGVRLRGPRFQDWIHEVEAGSLGDYRVNATLEAR